MPLLVYIDPWDTCFFREARAFGAEASTFAASGPPIGLTFYGALGSLVLAQHGCSLHDFVNGRAANSIQKKLGTYDIDLQHNTFTIQGPWLTYTTITGQREVFLPSPANLWASGPPGHQNIIHMLYPEDAEAFQGKHWDFKSAHPTLRPLTLPQALPGAWPPEPGKAFLPRTAIQQYLAGSLRSLGQRLEERQFYLRESRAGNRIAPESWCTAEAYLFFTEHLRFREALSGNVYRRAGLAVVANTLEPADIGAGCLYVGGERRQAFLNWEVLPGKLIPEDPQVLTAIQERRRFLIYLATPSIFSQGWLRPWPFTGAQLVGAAVGKPLGLSGWSRGEHHAGGRPRPFYRAVPAGSVYFFDAPVWQPEQFQELYSRFHCQESLSERYASAGLGVALIGVW